eukprot:m.985421 g.985421  ORF g.985421 m.985421 type:complete len:83 (-) comp23982_c2_seq19:428-676(-)
MVGNSWFFFLRLVLQGLFLLMYLDPFAADTRRKEQSNHRWVGVRNVHLAAGLFAVWHGTTVDTTTRYLGTGASTSVHTLSFF